MPFWRRLASGGIALAAALLLPAAAAAAADHLPTAAAPAAKAARPELGASAAFAPDGGLYAVASRAGQVLLYRSGDEGATWDAPLAVNAQPEAISADGENRPKLAFGADGAFLVAWTHPLGKPYSGEIRFARSAEGKRFSEPLTVHRDRAEITHRFESMLVTPDGRVVVAWIDKRDLEAAKAGKKEYRGAAIYAAVSADGGRSFAPESKVADHSCECCRIGMTVDADGSPLLMWRHVFAPNERDHALARLGSDGGADKVWRATFDHWRLDGCPHHGPSLAVAADGARHAVWFDQKDGAGRVFYGRLPAGEGGEVEGQRAVGGERAEHADLALAGNRVAMVWKEFDGKLVRLRAEISDDAGANFRPLELAATAGASDQPRALRRGEALYAFWHTEKEGMRVFRLQ